MYYDHMHRLGWLLGGGAMLLLVVAVVIVVLAVARPGARSRRHERSSTGGWRGARSTRTSTGRVATSWADASRAARRLPGGFVGEPRRLVVGGGRLHLDCRLLDRDRLLGALEHRRR